MTTSIKHMKRSRKTAFLKQPVFQSKDRAKHEISAGQTIYKVHKKKY